MVETFWRRCSSCKREIGFDVKHWTCSVTTCTRKGSSFVFCSVPCWDAHVPTMRHREAWAEEQRSPTRDAWAGRLEAAREDSSAGEASGASAGSDAAPGATASRSSDAGEPARGAGATAGLRPASDAPREVLIVASKLKKYVRARSGMNTSDSVMEVLSRRVRALCDDAILRAQEDGRKTILDRDF